VLDGKCTPRLPLYSRLSTAVAKADGKLERASELYIANGEPINGLNLAVGIQACTAMRWRKEMERERAQMAGGRCPLARGCRAFIDSYSANSTTHSVNDQLPTTKIEVC
jgi:hypothetical protein